MALVNIRGFIIAVHAKSGTQLKWYKDSLAKRPDHELFEMCENPEHMKRLQTLSNIRDTLAVLEQTLRGFVMDDMDRAEDECAKLGYGFDDFVEQDDGTEVGVVYAENASPALDAAVHNLWEAQMNIDEELANGNG